MDTHWAIENLPGRDGETFQGAKRRKRRRRRNDEYNVEKGEGQVGTEETVYFERTWHIHIRRVPPPNTLEGALPAKREISR